MSNNDNFKFPWLDQLQEFYDNSAKIIEDSANNLLKFDPINTHNPSDLKRMDTKIHHKKTKNEIKEKETIYDKKEVIYDKFYDEFKELFKKINYLENSSNPSEINDEQLKRIFNKLLKEEFDKKKSPNIAESDKDPDKYELAFSFALTRLTSKEYYDTYNINRVSKDEFELLLSNEQELKDIITKKTPNQNNHDFQKKLSDLEKPTTETSREWYDNIFSAPKQTLTTITSLFTGVISLIFEPTKTKDNQSQNPTRTPNKPCKLSKLLDKNRNH